MSAAVYKRRTEVAKADMEWEQMYINVYKQWPYI